MKLDTAINKYFSKDNLINSICQYELYYQIGLGNVALQTIQDVEETYSKLDELNLQIDTQKVFESIQEIVFHMSNSNDFEDKFEKQLRFVALVHMLDDFIQADDELLNSKTFTDSIYEQIKNDTFFEVNMIEQFNNDYENVISKWECVITDDVSNEIKDVVSEVLNKS